ncbi:hypothetical protein D3C80_2082360 [compost metagenome]
MGLFGYSVDPRQPLPQPQPRAFDQGEHLAGMLRHQQLQHKLIINHIIKHAAASLYGTRPVWCLTLFPFEGVDVLLQ